MEKFSPPKTVGCRTIQSILSGKDLVEPAPKPKASFTIRTNDDLVVLYRPDEGNEQYKYITGKSSDGKTYVGIMSFGDIHKHEDILNAVTRQFNVKLEDVRGGWVMISSDLVLIYGHSTYYPQSDHKTVELAMKTLLPEMANFDFSIESSKPSLMS